MLETRRDKTSGYARAACGLSAGLASLAGVARAQPPALSAELVRRYPAPEASQGAAAGNRGFYAIGNSEIGFYDKRSGRRLARWSGDPEAFPHMNSCATFGAKLVCAASNYPATPMASWVEIFDRARLAHIRTIPLDDQRGSLTWVTRRRGQWWACFANYDGKGGVAGRGHTATFLLTFDKHWRPLRTWRFPDTVLARFAPRSASGGVWAADGRLYVTGHDAAEIYVLRLPRRGDVLEHVATIAAPIEGQAIGIDPGDPRRFYGVSRAKREVVAMRLPRLPAR